jgi:hypothetical protein
MIEVVEDAKAEVDTPLSENEVTEIADSIRNASYSLYGSNVFDQTAMSPLSPTSLVSGLKYDFSAS